MIDYSDDTLVDVKQAICRCQSKTKDRHGLIEKSDRISEDI